MKLAFLPLVRIKIRVNKTIIHSGFSLFNGKTLSFLLGFLIEISISKP